MKKNKFMRLASGLLVGTLLTTCAISGTFAKYTTQDAANDSARVAKWGVELQIMGTLYGKAYEDAADNTAIDYNNNEDAVSVHTSADDKVVAPGTKSDAGLTFKLNGQPEVDSQIIAEITTENIFLTAGTYGVLIPATNVTAENYSDLYASEPLYVLSGSNYVKAPAEYTGGNYWTLEDEVKNDATYFPVVYNVTTTSGENNQYSTTYVDDTNTGEDTLAAIATEIAGRLANGASVTTVPGDAGNGNVTTYTLTSNVYGTNTNLATAVGLSAPTLSWDWDFTDTVGKDGDEADPHDMLDTILGHFADGSLVVKSTDDGANFAVPTAEKDYNLNTQFSIDITVNQVD